MPVEEEVPSHWAGVRGDEYRAGRAVAHVLLRRLGRDVATIDRAGDRTPHWPDDVCASISHTRSRVFVGGARRSDVACLGIDAEALGSVTAEVFDVLFVESEPVAIAQGIDPTTLCCCKEAVYKAVYP
ncbi:MAG: hypothetical protein CMD83_18915, partial [Gammaproteobacteria bacterium]|nr:hypothetical protein [Gammaproteobacteria bacterium]